MRNRKRLNLFRRSFWAAILILVIGVQLGIFVTSQLSLWQSWQVDEPPYWNQFQPFLSWAAGQIPEDAPVAWVTPQGKGDLGYYFTLSKGLYPRSVWWIRPGPCDRSQLWCIASNLDSAELMPVLQAYHVRYLIVADVSDLTLSGAEPLTFDQNWSLLKLEARE